MGENITAFTLSCFYALLGIIILLCSLYFFTKEYTKNSKKFNLNIVLLSFAGIFISIFLILGTYIVKNKIEKYNKELKELNISKSKKIEGAEFKDVSYEESIPEIDYQGTIGDLFGGIYGPIIGMLGAIFGGMAFYAQFKANKQVQDQFKLQQFESQFYEMLALHKDNLNEMKIEGYEFDNFGIKTRKDTTGRKIFYTITTELYCIYLIVKKIYFLNTINPKSIDQDTKKYLFSIAYHILFHGIEKTEYVYKSRGLLPKKTSNFFKGSKIGKSLVYTKKYQFMINVLWQFSKDDGTATYIISKNESKLIYNSGSLKNISDKGNFFEDLVFELREIRSKHLNDNISNSRTDKKNYKNYFTTPNYISHYFGSETDLKLYFNYKPFDGHQSRLGHYYRHLFSIVNHVVKQDIISYEEKRDYLKILRAQLSIYELSLLFYNYYSGFGENWESKHIKDNESKANSFFLDYRFLHNIEKDFRFTDIDPITILQEIASPYNIKCKKNCDLESDPVFELYELS